MYGLLSLAYLARCFRGIGLLVQINALSTVRKGRTPANLFNVWQQRVPRVHASNRTMRRIHYFYRSSPSLSFLLYVVLLNSIQLCER
jgi:hypothetical protein